MRCQRLRLLGLALVWSVAAAQDPGLPLNATEKAAAAAANATDPAAKHKVKSTKDLAEDSKYGDMDRLARFILDFANGDSSYGATGLNLANLFNLNVDYAYVMEGLFLPNVIAIHIAQNAFNFVTSTAAWVIAGSLYSNTNIGRDLFSSVGPAGPLAFVTKLLQDSPLFAAFRKEDGHSAEEEDNDVYVLDSSPAGTSSYFQWMSSPHLKTPVPLSTYVRQVKTPETEEAAFSMEKLDHILHLDEEQQAVIFQKLSDQEKLSVYKHAQAALAKQKAFNGTTTSRADSDVAESTKKRKRKVIRKPTQSMPEGIQFPKQN